MPVTPLTKLTDLVKVGDRETTILAEFKRQQVGELTATPTVREFHNNQPTGRCVVTLWNEGGGTASFNISPADLDYLRGQGIHVAIPRPAG